MVVSGRPKRGVQVAFLDELVQLTESPGKMFQPLDPAGVLVAHSDLPQQDSKFIIQHVLWRPCHSDDLDFLHYKKDLSVALQRIEVHLTGREEVVFR